jgi:hypothetical protein
MFNHNNIQEMKIFYTLIIALLFASNAAGQWQATNVSTDAAENVYDVAIHNGSLFGSINSKGLIKYNGGSWDSLPHKGFITNTNSLHIERIVSNGNFLYVVLQDQSCASSIVYKSSDDGETFVADTVGLPTQTCDNKPMNINYLYSEGDYIFLTLTSGINTYRKKPSDASWTLNPAEVKFSSRFVGNNSKWYGFYHKLVVSTDFGQSWTQPANVGLPTSNIANGLSVDPINSRIYLPLEIYSTFGTELVYSDDEGASWEKIDVNTYLSKDWIGLKMQRIISMVSQGDFMELALTNSKTKTTPDFLVSRDGGATFSKDTLGLPVDNWGTMAARSMVIYNNFVYAAVGPDIYKKSLFPVGIEEVATANSHAVYPNPNNGLMTISNLRDEIVEVFDIQGYKIISQHASTVDIRDFSNGVYFVKITSPNYTRIIKVIKN